eukprot:11906-Chlamydomonas_euryale.AAC.1
MSCTTHAHAGRCMDKGVHGKKGHGERGAWKKRGMEKGVWRGRWVARCLERISTAQTQMQQGASRCVAHPAVWRTVALKMCPMCQAVGSACGTHSIQCVKQLAAHAAHTRRPMC